MLKFYFYVFFSCNEIEISQPLDEFCLTKDYQKKFIVHFSDVKSICDE
jgi:hypothetical protein